MISPTSDRQTKRIRLPHPASALLLVAALFLSLTSPVAAQDGAPAAVEADPALPVHVSTTAEQATDLDSRFVVDRLTDRAVDVGRGLPPDGIHRSGSGNAAQILQRGDDNVTLLEQLGIQNAASLRIAGYNNRIRAEQIGIGNRLGLSVEGSNNEIPILQRGTNLQMQLRLQGVQGMTLPVQQTGTGIPIVVETTPGTAPR
jgi:hypothetical protein